MRTAYIFRKQMRSVIDFFFAGQSIVYTDREQSIDKISCGIKVIKKHVRTQIKLSTKMSTHQETVHNFTDG